ncbi:SGNH/GDSL hydrolase family protein [Elizabethkingia anophelis]|uniref:SGNH/GDSL hydrolase family protein n=1 Tax=Elizabethkingia anophelis TaxID=1117645 RepID=UPI002013A116|nr:SGNH/GDSL hydrolase family protein [Elizabethkingia anophelis]MCL1640984.1 SGNH/GDSL hydrolase family protein [Elizabethkingia anophelis]MCL1646785.1 SGNH/GDSL hydrolase family protein [Elizabethkingia anophelis]
MGSCGSNGFQGSPYTTNPEKNELRDTIVDAFNASAFAVPTGSYFSKDEKIPVSSIDGLSVLLGGKLDKGVETMLMNAFNAGVKNVENIANRAYLGLASEASIPPDTGAYFYKVSNGNVTTFPNLKDINGLPLATKEEDFFKDGVRYDVYIEVKDKIAQLTVNERDGLKIDEYGGAVGFNSFLSNSIDKSYDLSYFYNTSDNTWFFTDFIELKKGWSFRYKGFSAESIGKLYDINKNEISALPSGSSLYDIQTIEFVMPVDGFIVLKTAKISENNNALGSMFSLHSGQIYAKSNDIFERYKLSNLLTLGSSSYDIPFGDLSGQTKYYLNKVQYTGRKLLKSVKMFSQGTGVINFAIGSIDQWNKFVERKILTFNTVGNKINSYPFNEVLKENEYVAVKCPVTNGMSWISVSGSQGLLWDSGLSYSGALVHDTAHSIAMELELYDYEENSLAFNEDVKIVNEKLESLENKLKTITLLSPNGTPFKLAIDDNGNLISKSLLFNKIAHLGNSICRHQITSFWWGDWGMAATTRDKDYVHQFLSKYKSKNSSATTQALNIATWETGHTTYNKSQLDSTLLGSDLVVIRIGENVTWSTSFKSEFRLLVEYIISKVPNATLLIGGTFWYSQEKDSDMKAVADEKGITFVSMQGLDIPENKQTLSGQVFGDDNQWHTIADGGSIAEGVANHPNDRGMQLIAERLYNSLNV